MPRCGDDNVHEAHSYLAVDAEWHNCEGTGHHRAHALRVVAESERIEGTPGQPASARQRLQELCYLGYCKWCWVQGQTHIPALGMSNGNTVCGRHMNHD